MILPFFDHLPTSTWTFFTLNVDQNWHFLTTYPPHLVHVAFERPPTSHEKKRKKEEKLPAAVHGKIHIPNILWLASLCSLLVFTRCLIKEKQLLLVTHEKGLTNEVFFILFG